MNKTAVCLLVLCALMSAGKVMADDFISWHTSNIQLLRGENYNLGDDSRTIVTMEHANKGDYGDFFAFVDFSRSDDGSDGIYGEITPRFSLSNLTGKDLSVGAFSDFYLTTQLEQGKGGLSRYLVGLGTDVKAPGFTFLKLHLLNRNNPDRSESTWQFFMAWNYPLELGETKGVFEGFADFIGKEGPGTEPNQLIVPRFLIDIGPWFSLPHGKLQAGIEWQYWHNKFGIKGETESVPQIQFKWIF